ncbi:predicted protein [Sclerotinia sclerotiorum 1980 UF-70]|uniref:Uncharacterized protein n=1 Tax=Sclerotinia sclerotiorum (strain ATCC 18683 / 1980 / Ss-1) TaxID=665079 RepID=A7EM17_SCLS1|nr:predicted protein [Sclerotinia sclerotiorum 1980 UF-70]EDO03883.1 predicted protein [Sclerotinia sclerotiorum 1980 UF-70]
MALQVNPTRAFERSLTAAGELWRAETTRFPGFDAGTGNGLLGSRSKRGLQ